MTLALIHRRRNTRCMESEGLRATRRDGEGGGGAGLCEKSVRLRLGFGCREGSELLDTIRRKARRPSGALADRCTIGWWGPVAGLGGCEGGLAGLED